MENLSAWRLVSPEGVIRTEPFHFNPRPKTLDGKTVLLRWNGKHNGDVFLIKLAELLVNNTRSMKIIRGWEAAPETIQHSFSPNRSKKFAEQLATYKPDIVIGAQAD